MLAQLRWTYERGKLRLADQWNMTVNGRKWYGWNTFPRAPRVAAILAACQLIACVESIRLHTSANGLIWFAYWWAFAAALNTFIFLKGVFR